MSRRLSDVTSDHAPRPTVSLITQLSSLHLRSVFSHSCFVVCWLERVRRRIRTKRNTPYSMIMSFERPLSPLTVVSSSKEQNDEVHRRIVLYDRLANNHGWTKLRITTQNAVVQRQRYQRKASDDDDADEVVILDCWPTTGTIGSYLYHPRQRKKTQLFRSQCDDDMAARIFDNPRVHTGRGYQQRHQQQQQQSHDTQQQLGGRRKRHHSSIQKRERENEENNEVSDDDEHQQLEGPEQPQRKRRRVACAWGQACRNWACPRSHPPRCFYGAWCWFQPHCWFDHTHGLCRHGDECQRTDCWFSHRHPDFYY